MYNVWLIHQLRQTAKADSAYRRELAARKAQLPALMRQSIAEALALPKRPRRASVAKSANRSAKAEAERLAAERRAFDTFNVDLPESWSVVPLEQATGRYNPDEDERFAGDI